VKQKYGGFRMLTHHLPLSEERGEINVTIPNPPL
jgi:hypothetical protein